jgi:hypothetical protein
LAELTFVDIKLALVLMLGGTSRDRTERRATEEHHLHAIREAVEAEELALVFVGLRKMGNPFDGLAHLRHGVNDNLIEAAANIALPARHGGRQNLFSLKPRPAYPAVRVRQPVQFNTGL